MASIVDLPDPDGPTIAVNSPVPIATVTDLSAATGGDPGCSLDTPINSRALIKPPEGCPGLQAEEGIYSAPRKGHEKMVACAAWLPVVSITCAIM